MTKLNTRPPTCAVPWPLILVEGGEKSGKSWMFAELSASPKVGRSLWLDIGEGSADEYGDAITGKPTYEVVVHDGSWASIYGQVQAAHAEAKRARAAGEKPVCLGIDSMTLLWEMLKDWAGDRAARTDSNRARLARDPGAEIKIPTHIWTDVHARWSRLMRLLMTFEGIAVVTARGKDTIKIGGDGKPVEGERDYKVEAQRNLQFDATVWVRLSRDAHPMIVGARSKHLRIRYGRDEARVVPGMTLESLVFEGLRCGVDSAPRDLVRLGRERTPEEIRDDALATVDRDDLLGLLAEARHPEHAGATIVNEHGDEEQLTDMIERRGREVTGRPAPQQAQRPKQQQGRPSTNRFAKHQAEQAAQQVPPAPASAGSSPDEPADATLLDRLGQALTACGSSAAPQHIAVASALVGRKIKDLSELTRAEAVHIGQRAAAAARTPKPRQALAALVQEAVKGRQAATTTGEAA